MRGICAGVMLLTSLFSQGQVLRGVIEDEVDRTPLSGALVQLSEGSSAVTDDAGRYQFNSLEPGRYKLTVSFIAYRDQMVNDILIKGNRVTVQDVRMNQLPVSLEEVTVFSEKPFQVGGKRSISEDQIYRFASTYYDPARIMTTSPDVIIANDQNNQISVRGLSPNYNVWRLEDVEIINPNHLSNAGTLNDQPAGTGGGVNAISAQVLGNSSFNFGAMNADLSNSVGGVFDLKLKSGNQEFFQYTAQASLIGFDLMADGPIGEKTQLLVNYRYSFTGLLSQFGVDFGGESIGYQDLSVVSKINLRNEGKLKFFVIGGESHNDFEHTGFANAERQKDLSDINYQGNLAIVGIRYDKNSLSFSYALSGSFESRNETLYDELDNASFYLNTDDDRMINSALLQKSLSFKNGSANIQLGSNIYNWRSDNPTSVGKSEWNKGLGFIGADWGQFIGPQFNSELGIKYYNSFSESAFDYRAKLSYLLDGSSIYVSFGNYSQLLNPDNQYFNQVGIPTFSEADRSTDFITSQRSVIGYEWSTSNWSENFESFLYDFSNVQVLGLGDTGARSSGVSANVQRNTSDGWFALIGATYFNSIYSGNLNNRYNARYNGVANLGKEIELRKQEKRFEISMRQTVQGGNWYQSFDNLLGSESPDRLLLAAPVDYIQTTPYLRTDLRIQMTKAKDKSTRTFSLDIQNLLNRENASFFYYDTFLNEELQNTQLGMIPNITYRIDF